ncbi:MAG: DUF1566 domain-containing protein [Oscillospiraceae bacterium]|nr:DUF1566 domain-containing protein [Oscillospiraceae bacterium]
MKKCFIVLVIALCVIGVMACKQEPAHEHTWNEGEITTKATCTTDGVMTYTCTGCGEIKTEEIASTGHSIQAVGVVAANCGTDGTAAHYKCTVCNKLFSDAQGTTEVTAESLVVAKNGSHTLSLIAKVDETCTTDGTIAHYHCSVCEKNFSNEAGTTELTDEAMAIPATGHTFSDEWSWDVNKNTHYHAATCGHTDVRGDEASHTYNQVPTTPATCTENGIMTWTCTVCGRSFQTQINMLGHDYKDVAEVPATCTKDGAIAHRHCSRCGNNADNNGNTIANLVILATGHTWDEGTPDGLGNMVYECQTCHEKKTVAEYAVGDTGPAGGYIFYDCDADNDDTNDGAGPDGLKSAACGWRYLEAAATFIRIIDGLPTIDSTAEGFSAANVWFQFGLYKQKADYPCLYVNGTTTFNADDCTATAVGSGEDNTRKLVSAMGEEAYLFNGSKGTYAARLCYILSYTVGDVVYDDWFLPSKDELYHLVTNIGDKYALNHNYWSSSEDAEDNTNAWEQQIYNCVQNSVARGTEYRVLPIRSF